MTTKRPAKSATRSTAAPEGARPTTSARVGNAPRRGKAANAAADETHAKAVASPTASGLPRGLELLWGVGTVGARGPRPGLTVGGIVEAAVAIADADGIGGVSMASVAQALGFTTMSLYRYVTSKDELLVLMLDGAMGPPPEVPGFGHDWRADLAAWARAESDQMLAHPWVLHVPIAGPVMTPNQLGWLELGLRALARTPLSEDEKANLVLLLSGFVRNEAVLRQELAASEQRIRETTGVERPKYGAMMATLVDGEQLPHLMKVIEAGVFDDEGGYGDAEFEFGLERMLDGFGVLIDRRSGARRAAQRARKAARSATPRRG